MTCFFVFFIYLFLENSNASRMASLEWNLALSMRKTFETFRQGYKFDEQLGRTELCYGLADELLNNCA